MPYLSGWYEGASRLCDSGAPPPPCSALLTRSLTASQSSSAALTLPDTAGPRDDDLLSTSRPLWGCMVGLYVLPFLALSTLEASGPRAGKVELVAADPVGCAFLPSVGAWDPSAASAVAAAEDAFRHVISSASACTVSSAFCIRLWKAFACDLAVTAASNASSLSFSSWASSSCRPRTRMVRSRAVCAALRASIRAFFRSFSKSTFIFSMVAFSASSSAFSFRAFSAVSPSRSRSSAACR
mmetsp:Transcript_12441/g.46008  ORF Transcript_12441/g.46008 Transcript_12441/m.46008 type:complete len:240 (-) Transcript_12441:485-1204(-)